MSHDDIYDHPLMKQPLQSEQSYLLSWSDCDLQILQFATVAQTSPQVEETGSLSDGAVSVISFSLAIMLLPIMALLMWTQEL